MTRGLLKRYLVKFLVSSLMAMITSVEKGLAAQYSAKISQYLQACGQERPWRVPRVLAMCRVTPAAQALEVTMLQVPG